MQGVAAAWGRARAARWPAQGAGQRACTRRGLRRTHRGPPLPPAGPEALHGQRRHFGRRQLAAEAGLHAIQPLRRLALPLLLLPRLLLLLLLLEERR